MLPQCFLASSAIDAESNELAMSTASDDRSWPSARQSTQQAGVHLLQSPLESKTLVFSPWVSPLSNPSPIHRNKTQKKKREKIWKNWCFPTAPRPLMVHFFCTKSERKFTHKASRNTLQFGLQMIECCSKDPFSVLMMVGSCAKPSGLLACQK